MECIEAINKLQHMDVIIITRGGGDTSEISNSYDTKELFNCIRLSKVPIITAIGHEQDKGDKLLITNVSDKDFPTPTTLAKDLNHKFYEHLDYILNEIHKLYDWWFYKAIDNINKLYDTLSILIEDILVYKFGAKIIKLSKGETNVIIEVDGKYYKNTINYKEECDISDDISIRNDIIYALATKNIDLVNEKFKLIQFPGTDTVGHNNIEIKYTNIQHIIDQITEFTVLKKKKKKTDIIDQYHKSLLNTSDDIDNHLQIHNYNPDQYTDFIEMKRFIIWYKHILDEHINSIGDSTYSHLIPRMYNCINTIYIN